MISNEHEGFTRHLRRRRAFFAKYSAQWPRTLTNADAYDLLDVFVLSRAERDAIENAAVRATAIFQRMARLLETASDAALLEIGVPAKALALVRTRIRGIADPVIGRLDLVKVGHCYKVLEFNVDAPGLLMETFAINRAACAEAEQCDVNADGERRFVARLSEAVHAGLRHLSGNSGDPPRVAVAAYSGYPRDRDTADYLTRVLGAEHGFTPEFVGVETLRADANGLYEDSGRRIDVLLRAYPLFYLCRGIVESARGNRRFFMDYEDLRRLIEHGRLAIINAPPAAALESKAVLAAIWGLMQDGRYFGAVEREIIQEHFIPTWLDPPPNRRHVVKPFFGSNGDSIKVVDASGSIVESNAYSTYSEMQVVYQDYVPFPSVRILTGDGVRDLRMVWSCIVASGQPCGITLRVGSGVTDLSWWVVPVGVEN